MRKEVSEVDEDSLSEADEDSLSEEGSEEDVGSDIAGERDGVMRQLGWEEEGSQEVARMRGLRTPGRRGGSGEGGSEAEVVPQVDVLRCFRSVGRAVGR